MPLLLSSLFPLSEGASESQRDPETRAEPGAAMAEANPEQQPSAGVSDPDEDSPNMIVYRKVGPVTPTFKVDGSLLWGPRY